MLVSFTRLVDIKLKYLSLYAGKVWHKIGHFTVVLSVLAWIESEAGVDLVLIETSLLFLCK